MDQVDVRGGFTLSKQLRTARVHAHRSEHSSSSLLGRGENLQKQLRSGLLDRRIRASLAGKHGTRNVQRALTPGALVRMHDGFIGRDHELTSGRKAAL